MSDRFARSPLSAPAWLWILYFAGMVWLSVQAGAGWWCVTFAAMFSFQFWTFASWRGTRRQQRGEVQS
jgi:hypothetical protein